MDLEQHPLYCPLRSLAFAVLLILPAAIALSAGSALAAAPPKSSPVTCTGAWNLVASPNSLAPVNYLSAVAVVSTSDVWAVGSTRDTYHQAEQTLVEHWDGNSWSIVPSPNPDPNSNALQAVVALSAGNVWAAGFYTRGAQTLVEHWDGTAWTVVPSPNIGTSTNINALWGLAAVSASDIWAVGLHVTDGYAAYLTLIEHWDGTAWSIVPSPSPSLTNSELASVSAIAADDVWAVGRFYSFSGVPQTLVEHWDGSAWTVVPSPNVNAGENLLSGVTAISANNVWAVGHYASGEPIQYQTLIEHWDGTDWQVVPSPSPGTVNSELSAIAAVSANDIWAVGYRSDDTGPWPQTLTEHWDGTSWSAVSSPNGDAADHFLNAVAAVSANDIIAAGDHGQCCSDSRTLIERYTVPCAPLLVGHVIWQGRPAQPSALQQIPVTLTLRSAITQATYVAESTDPSGYFTVPAGTLPADTYTWRADAPKYLANSGTVTLAAGATSTGLEMGLMKTGDANSDNMVNIVDFAILHNTYGKAAGDPGYDDRADFTGDHAVTAIDFSLQKATFGQSGAPPLTRSRP